MNKPIYLTKADIKAIKNSPDLFGLEYEEKEWVATSRLLTKSTKKSVGIHFHEHGATASEAIKKMNNQVQKADKLLKKYGKSN